MNNKTTIVSAYFEINKSKHGKKNYYKWTNNFLKIKTPMVIFTNVPDVIQKIAFGNNKKNIYIIKQSFEEFYVYKYIQKWKQHLQMDHEKKIHNVYLYMLWNEKSSFVKKAIDVNPFDSNYFYWTDIGSFRKQNHIKLYINYPKHITEKVLLLNIGNFTKDELNVIKSGNINKNIFQYKNRIGGGIFGGNKEKCLMWYDKFYEMLGLFFENNMFAGKDQSIMACVAILNPNIVEIVKPIGAKYDPWFYLQEYLCR